MGLIKYMEKKKELLEQITKRDFSWLFTQKDRAGINRWSVEEKNAIKNKLSIALKNWHHGDNNLCPWCIKYRAPHHCNLCEFEKQHGNCYINKSDYSKAVGEIKSSLWRLLDYEYPVLLEALEEMD